MLAIAEFISKLAVIMGHAFHGLRTIREDQRQKQSQYLDSISEALAAAAAAIQTGDDPIKHIAELRFHLEHIRDVLRLGDPNVFMAVSDYTVDELRNELDSALDRTDSAALTPPNDLHEIWFEREDLKTALLNASGVFRGAAIAVKASDKAPRGR